MFVGEETSIASGVSFIRNRVDFVCLGESLPFCLLRWIPFLLFHMLAVCTPGLSTLWLLRHISPWYRKPWSHFCCRFGRKNPLFTKDIKVFLVAEVVLECQVYILTFSAFGIVHVWAIYKNNLFRNRFQPLFPGLWGFKWGSSAVALENQVQFLHILGVSRPPVPRGCCICFAGP